MSGLHVIRPVASSVQSAFLDNGRGPRFESLGPTLFINFPGGVCLPEPTSFENPLFSPLANLQIKRRWGADEISFMLETQQQQEKIPSSGLVAQFGPAVMGSNYSRESN